MKIFGKKCKKTDYTHREGVYGILTSDDKFGVAKVRDTHFLIGGGLDDDETQIECLHREFLEEVGYTIEVVRYIETFKEFHQSFRSKNHYELVAHLYEVKLVEHVSDGEPDHKLVWLTSDELEGNMVLDYQTHIIKSLSES